VPIKVVGNQREEESEKLSVKLARSKNVFVSGRRIL
jgi:hypothetical protein